MTNERRYQEDEVRQIFEAASEALDSRGRSLTSGEGLTLSELQEIGHEVGLSPEGIAEAASALDVRRSELPARTSLGMPVSVGRTVELARAPTDREWELLVAELRETFNARGKIATHGGLRQWTNGNLHAYVEPTETGHRLRLGTLKGNALAMNRMGVAGIAFSLIMLLVFVLTGQLASESLRLPMLFASMSIAALVSTAVTLPRWVREREAQMEYIASRATTLIGPGPDPDGT